MVLAAIDSNWCAPVGPDLDLLGRIPSGSIAEHLATSDGCLLLSLSESFGQPAVEVMAIGCPVLAADRPWAREVCGEAAFYVDPLDAGALSDAFSTWLDSKPAPLPLDEVRGRFSWAKHASGIAHLLAPGKVGVCRRA
jgi:glycosyltransferase involved in cell wall biosynthesis